MNITKRGIDIIPKKNRGIDIIPKKNREIRNHKNLFPNNYNFFHVNSYSEERKISCLRNNLIHVGAGMYEENMKEKRKGNGSTSHQAELFIENAIKDKTILYLFEKGHNTKGQYTHYGVFNGKIESSDNDIYPEVINKQPGIWSNEFQYAFYVNKWIPLTNEQKNFIYDKINPKGKSRRKTLQKINTI